MRQGAAAGNAAGFAIAARAAMADAMMRPEPCLECLKRGEAFARRAIAADPNAPDGHVWLAAALGYEARIVGLIRAKLNDDPGQAKENLDAALKADPDNAYALAALGGWNVEIVRSGGRFLARRLYDASLEQGLNLFDRAVRAAPRQCGRALSDRAVALGLRCGDLSQPDRKRAASGHPCHAGNRLREICSSQGRRIAHFTEARRSRCVRRKGSSLSRLSLTRLGHDQPLPRMRSMLAGEVPRSSARAAQGGKG